MIRALNRHLATTLGDLRARFARAEGQSMIEVALILSLVSMVTLGTISMTGTSVKNVLGSISGSVSGIQTGPTTTTQAPVKVKKKKKGG